MTRETQSPESAMVELIRRGRRTTRTLADHAGTGEVEARMRLERLADVGVVERVDDPLGSQVVWQFTADV
ncbi:FaeA/PapI family transcriptional regulator [Natrialbaceae archaeon A-chndr2]